MTDSDFAERAAMILHNMACERVGFWRQLFRRWHIHHEPLRNDAARLLTQRGVLYRLPDGCEYVGHDKKERD